MPQDYNPKGKALLFAKYNIRSEVIEGTGPVPDDEVQLDIIITNGEEDTYGSIMTEQTMRNYVEDCNGGSIPLMRDHSTESAMQLGMIVRGEYDEANKRVVANARVLRDTPQTPPDLRIDEYIRRMERGMVPGFSVAFRDADETCNICHKDIFPQRDTPDACPHVPKLVYDGVRCTYNVDNARLREVSFVTTPSTPGTGLANLREWNEDLRKMKQEGDFGTPGSNNAKSKLEREGQMYRENLVKEAIKMGVRAIDDFDEQTWRKRFDNNDAQFIIDQTETWKDLGDNRWGDGGRKTESKPGSESLTRSDGQPLILPPHLFNV